MLTDVRALMCFHDLKKKRGNGGGLSDGGLANIRESLTTQAVLIGPPPGKAWQGALSDPSEREAGFVVFNFDTLDANVEVLLVLEDGTEVPVTPSQLVSNNDFGDFEFGPILTYPMKLKVRTLEAHTKRVLFACLYTEFDVPSDLE